ncbi:hypothetical protein [Caulobacter sp. UNC358MFTsu5.1]|uniref:hypothetical protein n=1 Tax=Caulobacter sp. UNC358MFTsu5.1 TaxID=1449049 RepID=UPI0004A6F7F6|nr:hypothetical protein [Caulobacter sp. UNC358MFTsu5.1]
MRSILTLGAAALAIAFAAPALAQTAAPAQDPAAAAAPASAAAAVAAGQPVKDNTGAVIGSVTEVKPDATGKSMATIKMDDKTFAVDVKNLAVQDGATVINASKAEIEGMLGVKK